jgi:ribonucleoside-diphosphate reductase alpha chain
MTNTSPFPMPISEEIWRMKYRYVDNAGTPQQVIHDQTVQETWTRVATALAACEKDPLFWANRFYEALEDFKFIPAGRILAGAGVDRNVTLLNCYVMGTIPDDMTGIFDALKEAALTMQQGGGVGMDFSTIRPSGAPVRGVGADASGPLTFMDVWDSMCRTIMSAGTRRGAMMATMRCDHPDVEAFIEAKQDPARLRMFNVSVLVTDDFMEAVKNDEEWHLAHEHEPLEIDEDVTSFVEHNGVKKWVYRTVRARDLWNKIMRSTYDYAEPGVIFIDRINRDNNLWYIEEIAATNPCGEEPLPPYGACLLGSINLTCFVDDPFGENPSINYTALSKTVEVAVRMMDNVNDVSKFPLREQLREAAQKRRIGLGITGLADMLAMMKVPYNSSHGLALAEHVAKKIAVLAYGSSVELAKEKGAFPAFDAEQYLSGENFATRLPITFQNAIREHGIRNSHLLSVAPTGTISLYAGNVSSGIEPIFALGYNRKVTQKDGSKTEQRVEDYAVWAYRQRWEDDVTWVFDQETYGRIVPEETFDPETHLPDYFVTAQDLHPLDHVRMQAAVQPWVDSSISKTINVPVETSFEDFEAVYLEAYEEGCKGCTTYRPNDVTGSVISVDEPPAETVSEAVDDVVPPSVPLPLRDRPDVLDGQTYKVKLGGEPAFYVTITDIMEDGARRPFEVFINTKNPEHIAWSTALTRMISAIFRRPHDSSFVVEELKNVFDPKGGGFWKGQYRPSVVAAIGQVLEDHMKAIGYIQSNLGVEALERAIEAKVEAVSGVTPAMLGGQNCPKCFGFNLKRENGCAVCLDCGYSQCG